MVRAYAILRTSLLKIRIGTFRHLDNPPQERFPMISPPPNSTPIERATPPQRSVVDDDHGDGQNRNDRIRSNLLIELACYVGDSIPVLPRPSTNLAPSPRVRAARDSNYIPTRSWPGRGLTFTAQQRPHSEMDWRLAT
jgi:hypothetical protein